MPEQASSNKVEFTLLKYNPKSALLLDFFALRHKVYSSFSLTYYFSAAPTKWDKSPGSEFLILHKNGVVVGGRRFIIHKPGTDVITYCEVNTGKKMAEMLPHLPVTKLGYSEFGSLCLDDSLRGTGFSKTLYQKSFELMRQLNVDFIISNPVRANAARLENAAIDNGIRQIVWRPDLPSIEDGDHDPTLFLSFKTPEELDLTLPI